MSVHCFCWTSVLLLTLSTTIHYCRYLPVTLGWSCSALVRIIPESPTQTFYVNTDTIWSALFRLQCTARFGVRTSEAHSIYRRSSEHNHQLSSDLSLVCWWHSAHWIFNSCRHSLHQRTSTAVYRRYLTLVLITSATTEPVESGAYLVQYPLQPPEDNHLWSLAADQQWRYQWQASNSWPGRPVGLRVDNEATSTKS